MFQNNDTNGRFHTDWLNMIYPRLKLARDLLSDDGVIFISIDDNEVHNLRKVCDEIFGPRNLVGNVIRKTKSITNDIKSGFNIQHEECLVYTKNLDQVVLSGGAKDFAGYSNPDNDPNGDWASGDPSAKSGGAGTYFEIYNPHTKKVDLPPKGRYWAFSKNTLDEYIKRGKIQFKKNHKDTERGFVFKKYKNDAKSNLAVFDSLQTSNDFLNQVATKETNEIFQASYFSYPKPVSFVSALIKAVNDDKAVILDFFSGSASTAHAVMQLNAEDGGSRKFICVQLPETTDKKSEAYKAGFTHITEIGKERIRRAGAKIAAANRLTAPNLDIGFRVLKVDSSNMKPVFYNPEDPILTQDFLDNLVSNIKEDRTAEDLLFQIMLDMGVDLASPIEVQIIAGKKIFAVGGDNLICCFDEGMTKDVVVAIAKQKPLYAVFRDSSFKDDSTMVSFDQLFKTYSPMTERRVI